MPQGISNMIALSSMVGNCGKQCIVCGKEENRCTKCGHTRAEHCTHPGSCDCSKEHHKFDKQALRDSHAYSDGMLFRVCGRKDDEFIWDATKGPKVASRKPSTCCWSLLCKECEQTTSAMEGRVCQRHDSGYYDSRAEGLIHREDVMVFRAFTYRAMPVNTDIFHFLQWESLPMEHQATGNVLKTLHCAFDETKQGQGRPSDDPIASSTEGMLYMYHDFQNDHYIEFPFLCKADLTTCSVELGQQWLVYGQMPPYYWAFPLNPDKASLLQRHFQSIICGINLYLAQQREEYYQKVSDASQKRGMLKLVVGYLRRLGKCYIKIAV